MKVARNTVVRFHYTLADEAGTELETSRGGTPVAALVGHGNLIPGLEQALLEQEAGATLSVTVPPEAGYGLRQEDRVQRLPKKYFKEPGRLRPGMTTVLSTREGPRPVTVRKVGMSVVDVDLNHPMAGRTLVFEVEVLEVRAAAEVEISHGHVHGDGGHQH